MKQSTYHYQFLTLPLVAGAEPEKAAEIRVPSLRGQLRWWFRALGGFTALADQSSIEQQEQQIFGSAAGQDNSNASQLILRLAQPVRDEGPPNASKNVTPDNKYVLWPLDMGDKERHVFPQKEAASFTLHVLWRGNPDLWDSIAALLAVLGHLGALGMRSRRGFGALAFRREAPLSLASALRFFHAPGNVALMELPLNGRQPHPSLIRWLKDWRTYDKHHRSENPEISTDRDAGVQLLKTNQTDIAISYRPALGLPMPQIIPREGEVHWNFAWDRKSHQGKERFASPILLRPHRLSDGKIIALVLFLDQKQFPANHQVQVNWQTAAGVRNKQRTKGPKAINVSSELYQAMKGGPLHSWIPT